MVVCSIGISLSLGFGYKTKIAGIGKYLNFPRKCVTLKKTQRADIMLLLAFLTNYKRRNRGMLRVGLAHYNTVEDVDRFIRMLSGLIF